MGHHAGRAAATLYDLRLAHAHTIGVERCDDDELGYGWQTYPERLQKAGITWKIYQDIGDGLDKAGVWGFTPDPYIGNYGENSLLYFFNYRNATPGSPLYQRARTGTDVNVSGGFFDILAADVKHGRLPRVSWIVAPEAYTEHPAWPAGYGAWYTAGVLNALTSDPEVWSKTALLITFDENDGFFDHVVGPYPNVGGLAGHSTVALENELFGGQAGTPGGSTELSDRTVSAYVCRCSSSRRGAEVAGSPLRRSTTRRRFASSRRGSACTTQHHSVAESGLR